MSLITYLSIDENKINDDARYFLEIIQAPVHEINQEKLNRGCCSIFHPMFEEERVIKNLEQVITYIDQLPTTQITSVGLAVLTAMIAYVKHPQNRHRYVPCLSKSGNTDNDYENIDRGHPFSAFICTDVFMKKVSLTPEQIHTLDFKGFATSTSPLSVSLLFDRLVHPDWPRDQKAKFWHTMLDAFSANPNDYESHLGRRCTDTDVSPIHNGWDDDAICEDNPDLLFRVCGLVGQMSGTFENSPFMTLISFVLRKHKQLINDSPEIETDQNTPNPTIVRHDLFALAVDCFSAHQKKIMSHAPRDWFHILNTLCGCIPKHLSTNTESFAKLKYLLDSTQAGFCEKGDFEHACLSHGLVGNFAEIAFDDEVLVKNLQDMTDILLAAKCKEDRIHPDLTDQNEQKLYDTLVTSTSNILWVTKKAPLSETRKNSLELLTFALLARSPPTIKSFCELIDFSNHNPFDLSESEETSIRAAIAEKMIPTLLDQKDQADKETLCEFMRLWGIDYGKTEKISFKYNHSTAVKIPQISFLIATREEGLLSLGLAHNGGLTFVHFDNNFSPTIAENVSPREAFNMVDSRIVSAASLHPFNSSVFTEKIMTRHKHACAVEEAMYGIFDREDRSFKSWFETNRPCNF